MLASVDALVQSVFPGLFNDSIDLLSLKERQSIFCFHFLGILLLEVVVHFSDVRLWTVRVSSLAEKLGYNARILFNHILFFQKIVSVEHLFLISPLALVAPILLAKSWCVLMFRHVFFVTQHTCLL